MADAMFKAKLAVQVTLLRAASRLVEGERRTALVQLADAFDRLRREP